ncbi:DNA-binding protein [Martelella lutilitoris]|uniref:DNA-binding protein n=1 Tax=Martelella lutilitoris TaxID=2583532 RepID=A0A5C4JQT6_9HYPH|nr:OB-fold domain-containing protein [Martelella lutilitoris]TNB47776.1 DNA-binding protein [Martelella lutilitoris]
MTNLLLEINPEARHFWKAAEDGHFLIGRCLSCGEAHWYPRDFCPLCESIDTRQERSPGAGEIYSWTIMRRPADALFALGYVDLDEGPRIYVRFRKRDHERLAVGRRVRMTFETAGSGNKFLVAALVDGAGP